jgi:general secretion pathway protein D
MKSWLRTTLALIAAECGAIAWPQVSPPDAQRLSARTEFVEPSEPVALLPLDKQCSFHLHADKRNAILQVLDAFGIHPTIDASVNGQQLHFDADGVDFIEAADLLKLATGTFFVTLDPEAVMVVADTPENRGKFGRLVTKTFYFPGLSSKELTDMGSISRNVFSVEQSAMDSGKGTLTVRAPEPELEVLDQIYAQLLAGGSSQLQLEVGLYEIDQTRATNLGLILPTSTTVFNVPSEINSILKDNASLVDQLLKSDPSLAGNYAAILAALIASGALTGTVFNSPFALFGGGLTETGFDLSGLSVNMLLNSSEARSFKQLELRVLDQEEATIRSGEKYPILTSSYSSLASNSSSNGTIPQFQYEDLGLTLKVTPHIEREDQVSLNLDMRISSLTGTSLNSIPILANRQYTGIVSLRLGDSALLVSNLSNQESRVVTGVPWLSDIPGLSGTNNREETKDRMDLAIVITPHLVRLAHHETVEMLMLPRH